MDRHRFVVLSVAALIAAAFWLGPVRKIEPFYTYFYLWAWGPLLGVMGLALRRRAPASSLHKSKTLFYLFPFSVTLWLLFEVLNFRLGNWTYHGLPYERVLRWPGYALSFSTVAPAILLLAALLNSSDFARNPRLHPGNWSKVLRRMSPRSASDEPGVAEGEDGSFNNGTPAGGRGAPSSSAPEYREPPSCSPVWDRSHQGFLMFGISMLVLCLASPVYFFPLAWGFAFFLADPLVERWGGHSLLADWRNHRFSTTKALLLAGLLCGGTWEFCNFWAGGKWVYHLPVVGAWKIFEMPVLGFLGFPAFALEVHAAHELTQALLARHQPLSTQRQIGLMALMILFWMLAFAGIDRWTVHDFR